MINLLDTQWSDVKERTLIGVCGQGKGGKVRENLRLGGWKVRGNGDWVLIAFGFGWVVGD